MTQKEDLILKGEAWIILEDVLKKMTEDVSIDCLCRDMATSMLKVMSDCLLKTKNEYKEFLKRKADNL